MNSLLLKALVSSFLLKLNNLSEKSQSAISSIFNETSLFSKELKVDPI